MTDAIRVGRLTVVAQPDPDRLRRLATRLAGSGHDVRESPHFVVGRVGRADQVVLAHGFGASTVDEDLAALIAEELGPLGLVTSSQEYGEALFAIVASTAPSAGPCSKCGRVHVDPATVWRHYCTNTLRRLRALLAAPPDARAATTHVEQFAAVYRRVIDCCVGDSVLDVGSSLGFLPVLLGELRPDVRVAGCDNRQDAVAAAADLAAVAGGGRATFSVRDVLAPDFPAVGRFDTVAAVHVLEHLTDAQLPVALANLLRVTGRRLVVAVPYEAVAQPLYGHEQAFTREGLRALGEWCVEAAGGGRIRCEDVCGGLLIYDHG